MSSNQEKGKMIDEIDEVTASQIAGVSLSTLDRFAEAGYLHTIIKRSELETRNGGESAGTTSSGNSNSLRMFKRSEIISLFSPNLLQSVPSGSVSASQLEERSEQVQTKLSTTSNQDLAARINVETQSVEKAVAGPANNQIENPVEVHYQEAEVRSAVSQDTISNSTPSPKPEQVKHDPLQIVGRTNFEQLASLQERLLEAKDRELSDLKRQRDWLQERIEQYERKAERDQVLLLSKSQTIQKLVDNGATTRKRLPMISWFRR